MERGRLDRDAEPGPERDRDAHGDAECEFAAKYARTIVARSGATIVARATEYSAAA